MSNRRRPNGVDAPAAPVARPRPDETDEHLADVDAASLGFADLAEPGVHDSVLPEFRNLRARLFGDFDVDAPAADLDRLPSPPAPRTQPRVPRQVGIANGAPTAADVAAARVEEPEELEVPEPDPVHEPEPEPEPEPVVEPEPEPEPEAETDPEAELVLAPEPEPVVETEPEPAPAFLAPQPSPDSGDESLVPSSAAVTVDEPSRRPTALYVTLSAIVVAALVGGWLLLRGNDDEPSAGGSPTTTSSATVRASSTAVTEIDEQSVRTSQQLDFDAVVTTLRLVVPAADPAAGTADFDPEITGIEVAVPGQPTQQVDDDLAPGEAISIELDHPAKSLELSYAADGTVVRTEPSSAHRAKALVTPLTVNTAEGSDTTLSVEGEDVLNLGCSEAGATVACGEQTDTGWTVTPDSATTKVIAQIDLPQ